MDTLRILTLSRFTVITANYIWGPDRVLVKKEVATGNEYYYIYNGHGDVIQIVDRGGNAVNSYSYDEWGNILTEEETIDNPFKYTGEIYDVETGLYYLRARYYDPTIGRFISEDSFEGQVNNPLSLNQYAYVRNNPLIYVDPSGHLVVGAYGEAQGAFILGGYGNIGAYIDDNFNFLIAYSYGGQFQTNISGSLSSGIVYNPRMDTVDDLIGLGTSLVISGGEVVGGSISWDISMESLDMGLSGAMNKSVDFTKKIIPLDYSIRFGTTQPIVKTNLADMLDWEIGTTKGFSSGQYSILFTREGNGIVTTVGTRHGALRFLVYNDKNGNCRVSLLSNRFTNPRGN